MTWAVSFCRTNPFLQCGLQDGAKDAAAAGKRAFEMRFLLR